MDTDAMTDYYWENLKDILQRQLADDDEYRALIQKKIAAEIALKALIGEEAWSLYLELDAISNELESVRPGSHVSGRCCRSRKVIQIILMPPMCGIFFL